MSCCIQQPREVLFVPAWSVRQSVLGKHGAPGPWRAGLERGIGGRQVKRGTRQPQQPLVGPRACGNQSTTIIVEHSHTRREGRETEREGEIEISRDDEERKNEQEQEQE